MFKFIKPVSLVLLLPFMGINPVHSESLAGAYLSGTNASFRSDYKAASFYFDRALQRDPQNPFLMQKGW